MIEARRKEDIFHIREDWFEGYWHFSFGGPQGFPDPENTSFGTLRVFNIDTLAPGGMWPMHSHQDIEVSTYALDGKFQHAALAALVRVLHPGDVQHTTVGRGMLHEEINHRDDAPMTFLQIWVMPEERGLEPSVEQRAVDPQDRLNRFLTLMPNTNPDALPIRQDAEFLVSRLEASMSVTRALNPGYWASAGYSSGRSSTSSSDSALPPPPRMRGSTVARRPSDS